MALNKTNNIVNVRNVQNNFTTNVAAKRSLGRGALYGSDTASHWFGGLVDTLTGFGVFKFFFLTLLFLVFVRFLFSADSQVPLSFSEMISFLNRVPQTDYKWVEDFTTLMNNCWIPSTSSSWGLVLSALQNIFALLWMPIKALLYLFTAIWNFLKVITVFTGWFFNGTL